MLGSAGGEWLGQKFGISRPGAESITGMVDPRTEQIIMSGAFPGMGRAAGVGLRAGLRSAPAMRGMLRDIAQAGLGKMLPREAQEAKAFYQMAGRSGQTVPLEIPIQTGKRITTAVIPHSFQEAQGAINNLRNVINGMRSRGERGIEVAEQHLKDLYTQIDSAFPGFKAAQKGYAQLKDHELLQSFVNKKGPLRAFEQELAQGKVMGPSGLVQGPAGRLKFLDPNQIKTARSILEQLGPEPGEHIFKNLVEGRAVGHLLGALGGGAMGLHEAGWQGATAGAATGLFIPRMLNWMVAQGLRHPTTTAMIQSAIEKKGLGRPEFWAMLAQVGGRLGMNMLKDPETQQEEAAKQQAIQAQQSQLQAMQMLQQQQGGGEEGGKQQ
jgi:hypothetical protein